MEGKKFKPGKKVYHPESGEEFILIEKVNDWSWLCRKAERFGKVVLSEADLIPF